MGSQDVCFYSKMGWKVEIWKKKKVFEEENVARIRMFLTFSIKTKLFAWKCQIRKHNASFQNVDISDISKCRHFRDFSTLPKVEMSKCQFKIKHFILNFPIRKLEIFIQFWHFPIKRCKNVDFFFSGNPTFCWENISVEEFQPALKNSGADLESSSADCRHCSLLQIGILKCLFLRLQTFPCEPLLWQGKKKKISQLFLFFALWPDPISDATLEIRHKYSKLVRKPGIKGLSRKLLSMTLRKGVRSSLPCRRWRAPPGNSRQVRDVSSCPLDFLTHSHWWTPRSSDSWSRALLKSYLQDAEGRAWNKATACGWSTATESAMSFKH